MFFVVGEYAARAVRVGYADRVLVQRRPRLFLSWLVQFTWTQVLCCVFPGALFLALAASHLLPPWVARYDFLLAACLALQWGMLTSRLETRDELKVIAVFHVLGLALELFKVHHGSWAYPEDAYTKVAGVPLYSGFMYASVASYLCQAWRRFDLRLRNLPPFWAQWLLALAIYLNFFSHHYLPDLRWPLALGVLLLYGRTVVTFHVAARAWRMPLPVSFVLIGFFIWVAENLATLFGAWQYPSQADGWTLVDLGKFSSWFLLVIVSFIVVAALKQLKGARHSQLGPRSST